MLDGAVERLELAYDSLAAHWARVIAGAVLPAGYGAKAKASAARRERIEADIRRDMEALLRRQYEAVARALERGS